VVVVLLSSLNALAQKVTIDFDKGTDFSRSKTFAWIKGTPVSNPKLDLYIMGVGDHQLEQKGLAKVEAKNADLLITYHAAGNAEINATILDNDSYALSLGLPQTTVVTWWALPRKAQLCALSARGLWPSKSSSGSAANSSRPRAQRLSWMRNEARLSINWTRLSSRFSRAIRRARNCWRNAH
jgi:hypothetical protein